MAQSPLEVVLDRLAQKTGGKRATRAGDGYVSRCPAHDDQNPSLSVRAGDDGRVLVHCFSGCSSQQVVDALGMTMTDLFPSSSAPKVSRRVVATYDYKDETGRVLFTVERLDPKGFRQRQNQNGEKVWKLGDVRRVLFRLPELVAADLGVPVYIAEGEKDAEALAQLGLIATTNPQGAGKWRPEYGDALRGRHVVILPDHDDVGRKHAEDVARNLDGVAASSKVLALDVPEKGDVSDWLDGGGTRERLEALVAEAPVWRRGGSGDEPATIVGDGVVLVSAAEFQPAPVRWAWEDRIPLGMVTLLVGVPGQGKSTLTIELAARASQGHLPGDLLGQPATVVLATAEDAIAQVVVPRLIAAGAALERVQIVQVRRDGMVGGLSLPEDIEAFRAQLLAAAARIVVVDPLVAHIGGGVNTWKDQDVRRVLAPLGRLAEDADAAILGVMHLNKAQTSDVLNKVGGSVGFGAAARSVLFFAAEPDTEPDSYARVLAHAKSNVGALAPALRFRIEGREVVGGVKTSGVVWCGEARGVSASDLVKEATTTDEREAKNAKANALRDAEAIIRELLAEGPREAEAIRAELRRLGIPERRWREVKDRLGVRSRKATFNGPWEWYLPTTDDEEDGSPICHGPRPLRLSPPSKLLNISKKIEEDGVCTSSKGTSSSVLFEGDEEDEGDGIVEERPLRVQIGQEPDRTEPDQSPPPCRVCRGRNFWEQSPGTWICSTCHPDPRTLTKPLRRKGWLTALRNARFDDPAFWTLSEEDEAAADDCRDDVELNIVLTDGAEGLALHRELDRELADVFADEIHAEEQRRAAGGAR